MNGIDENNLPGLQDPLATKEGHQKVELFISCRGLKNKDLISLSDPQVKIYITKNNEEILLGETECIKDNLNPNFVKSFLLDYVFEIKQSLHFKIIDVDDSNGNFDPLGDVYTSLGEIMGARNQVLIADIMESNKKGGKLILRTEIVDGMQSHATFEISGKKLTNNAGFFSKSNPFFRFSRVHEELTNITVFESEVIKKNLNPNWKPFEMSFKTLCNNDAVRPILCSVYHKKPRQDKLMGQCTFSVDDIQSLNVKEFQLKKPKTKTKTYGALQIRNFTVAERPSFLEYIRRGIQLNVVAAIDFTSSNGNPKSVASLHAIRNDDQLNDYQKALHGVCDILLCYDYDKKVPVYGFGGKPFESNQVSHCFALTGNEEDPSTHGLDGIMELYKNSLAHIRLSSPTFFKHILRKGMDIAVKAKAEGSTVYTILMIITDGLIHDMQQTIDMLVDCAELPLSIIIVGVGNEDFSMMETLDADHGPTLCNSRGEKMKRDLVQFVAFNKYKGDKAALAEEVLAEVPRQLIDYMKSQGISPKRPDEIDVNNLVFARGESKKENELIKPSDINLQSLKKPVSNVDLDNKQEGGRAI